MSFIPFLFRLLSVHFIAEPPRACLVGEQDGKLHPSTPKRPRPPRACLVGEEDGKLHPSTPKRPRPPRACLVGEEDGELHVHCFSPPAEQKVSVRTCHGSPLIARFLAAHTHPGLDRNMVHMPSWSVVYKFFATSWIHTTSSAGAGAGARAGAGAGAGAGYRLLPCESVYSHPSFGLAWTI